MNPQVSQQNLLFKKIMEFFPSFSFSLILTEILFHLGSFSLELIVFSLLWLCSQLLLSGIKSIYKK